MLKLFLIVAIALQTVMPCTCNAEDDIWRNRVSAEEVVTSADIVAEVTFGRAVAARILGMYLPCDNPALLKYINLVGNTLVLNSNRPELEFHFILLDTDELASYAAPGGYVFISTGSLKLMEDESELAGVLAHEIAHISARDIVKTLKIKGADDSTTLAMLISGSSGSGTVRAALQPVNNSVATSATFSNAVQKGLLLLYSDEYPIEEVRQADRSAVIISALSGYEPAGLIRYLDRIKQLNNKAFTQSGTAHLQLEDRISQIKGDIAKKGIDDFALAKNRTRFTETMTDFKEHLSFPEF
jgi:predicted Zn-dependent protease